MPPNDRGRPLAGNQKGGPGVKVLTTDTAIVTDDDAGIRWSPGTRSPGRRLTPALASLYAPAAGRTWWWLSIRCPHCGSVHLGGSGRRARLRGRAGLAVAGRCG
jgi:hypothetical protein